MVSIALSVHCMVVAAGNALFLQYDGMHVLAQGVPPTACKHVHSGRWHYPPLEAAAHTCESRRHRVTPSLWSNGLDCLQGDTNIWRGSVLRQPCPHKLRSHLWEIKKKHNTSVQAWRHAQSQQNLEAVEEVASRGAPRAVSPAGRPPAGTDVDTKVAVERQAERAAPLVSAAHAGVGEADVATGDKAPLEGDQPVVGTAAAADRADAEVFTGSGDGTEDGWESASGEGYSEDGFRGEAGAASEATDEPFPAVESNVSLVTADFAMQVRSSVWAGTAIQRRRVRCLLGTGRTRLCILLGSTKAGDTEAPAMDTNPPQ
jgi:hypothetical protein